MTLRILAAAALPNCLLCASALAQAPACYPDAPPVLTSLALADAQVVARGGGNGAEAFPDLVLYTFTHAVVTQSAATASTALALQKLRGIEFAAATAQTSKQVSSGPNVNGSTSLIEKPNFAKLLSFAVEHGAVTKQVDGTTLKLASSPYALIAAAQGDTSTTYQNYDFFNHIGISANFRIDGQNNLLASARRKQLEQWSIRFRLTQDYSARSAAFQQFWDTNIKPKIELVPRAITGEAARIFQNNQALVTMIRDKENAYLLLINNLVTQKASAAMLQEAVLCYLHAEIYANVRNGAIPLTDAQRKSLTQDFIPNLAQAQLLDAEGRELAEREISRLADLPEATIAYTNYRRETASGYSELQFLYERKTFTPMKLIVNAGLSLYNNPNPALAQEQVRNYTASLSFEGKGGRSPFVTNPEDHSVITYAFTGRYERMPENRHRANLKADIALAQFRLDIPVQTGVTIPISFTYANSTSLIKEREVRGNFGLTLDTDKLIALARLVAAGP